METFEVKEFDKIFRNLGLKKGDSVMVHSSLLYLGVPIDCSISDLPENLFNELFKTLGIQGTIAVPTFNFDFCKGVEFNRQKTPSQNMGVFSEFVRIHPESKRSTHPMQSIAVVGSMANFVVEFDTESSFSKQGPFDRLHELDGKILLLGADFNSVSMIHLVEEKYGVPYRYWKSFLGKYIDNNISSERSYKMFVRSMEINPLLKLYSIEKELIKANRLQQIQIGEGYVKVFSIRDFVAIAEDFIHKNSYYFVSNHPNFEKL